MIISMDESGSFVESKSENSCCVVAAYVIPERIQSRSFAVLRSLKRKYGASERQEIKLKVISEKDYFLLLKGLIKLRTATLFVVATDSYHNTNEVVIAHKNKQAEKIRENIPRMIYKEGKMMIQKLAEDIANLSPQLYTQLQCQVMLIEDVLSRGMLYYVQRDPVCLRRFKWRIDQKNTTKTTYEKSFENITPVLLQTISFRKPMIHLEGADYSHLEKYNYSEEEVPEYVEEAFRKKLNGGINIGKIIRDNMSFPDSKHDLNVQIADLLAAGVRRCIRG